MTIRARAADDSANLGAAVSVAVTVGARTCPCSIWGAGAVPVTPADPDGTATEVGTKFRADVTGQVHRDPLLQELDQHRYARGPPVVRGRRAARRRHLHR